MGSSKRSQKTRRIDVEGTLARPPEPDAWEKELVLPMLDRLLAGASANAETPDGEEVGDDQA